MYCYRKKTFFRFKIEFCYFKFKHIFLLKLEFCKFKFVDFILFKRQITRVSSNGNNKFILRFLDLNLKEMSFCHNLWFSVFSQWYFPKGDFPSDNFPKWQLPKCVIFRAVISQWFGGNGGGDRTLRLWQTCKVATRENTLGKLPLRKNPLGKVHRFSNHYVFATQCSRPLIINPM